MFITYAKLRKPLKLRCKMNEAIMEKTSWSDLAAKASIISVCVAILGVTIGSPIYLGNKIESFRSEVKQDMNEFRREMKDFHGRLCTIEERNRK